MISNDQFSDKSVFIIFLKILFDNLTQIGVFFLFNGIFHFIFEIILSLFVNVGLAIFTLNEIVLVDILIHFRNLVLEFDHQFIN